MSFTKMNRKLTSAVSEAERQLAELRSRVVSLRGDVRTFAPHAYHRAFESTSTDVIDDINPPSRPVPNVADDPPEASRPTDAYVRSLSEDRAKELLLVSDEARSPRFL